MSILTCSRWQPSTQAWSFLQLPRVEGACTPGTSQTLKPQAVELNEMMRNGTTHAGPRSPEQEGSRPSHKSAISVSFFRGCWGLDSGPHAHTAMSPQCLSWPSLASRCNLPSVAQSRFLLSSQPRAAILGPPPFCLHLLATLW